MGIRAYLTRMAPADVLEGWAGRDDIQVPMSLGERVFDGDGVELGKGFQEIAVALGGIPSEPWSSDPRTRRFLARLLDGEKVLGDGALLDPDAVRDLAEAFDAVDDEGLVDVLGRVIEESSWSIVPGDLAPFRAENLAVIARAVIGYAEEAAQADEFLMVWVA